MSTRAIPILQARTQFLFGILTCLWLSTAALAADSKPAASNLTAAQIVEKHVAARGGSQVWRAVQTLSVSGKIEAGSGDSAARSARVARRGMGASAKRAHTEALAAAGKVTAAEQVKLPFTLEMKRPGKSRLEIEFAGKTAVQVYDGVSGWKLRPYLNREDVEPFSAAEAKSEAAKAELEGPLVDYVAKGTSVTLQGRELVDGHDAYKLELKMKNGDVQNIWIDTQSFLDVKVEGLPRQFDGKLRKVWISQRDFRSVQGLKMPYLYETAIEGSSQTHKMIIQTVNVNRPLDDSRFAKPQRLVAASPAPAPVSAASLVASK